jgi:diphthamide biosynthesis methyltransferase
MGGMHVTSDDLFISMEKNVRNEERAKVEKNRKKRLQLQATEEKTLALLEQGKPVNLLSVADLDMLLA